MTAHQHRHGDVFIHGITQRSGTNFLFDLLSLHHDLVAGPRQIWELPFLSHCDSLLRSAESFCGTPHVRGMDANDLLPYYGDAVLNCAGDGIEGKSRLLFKEPSVTTIDRFFDFFPGGFLIFVIRDGRDVAISSMKTAFAAPPRAKLRHPKSYKYLLTHPFAALAERWKAASDEIREFQRRLSGTPLEGRCKAVRYEDLVRDKVCAVGDLLRWLDLDLQSYDFGRTESLGVRGSSFSKVEQGRLDWERSEITSTELGSVGRWKACKRKDIVLYERIAGEALTHWGYL